MNGSQLSTSRPATDETASSPDPTLERLRTQIHRAAEALDRLRTENHALRERVAELEARPTIGENEVAFPVNDPEALREQITGFIDTIDTYLAEHHETSNGSDDTRG